VDDAGVAEVCPRAGRNGDNAAKANKAPPRNIPHKFILQF